MAEPDMAADRITAFRRARWVFVIVGVLCIVAGAIVLDDPHNSLATIAVVTGIFLVIDGIVELLVSFPAGADGRALRLVIGVVGIVVGIILIRHPIRGVVAVAMFVGLWLIVTGAARLGWSAAEPPGIGWQTLLAVVEIIAGVVIVSSPGIGVTTLALFIGIALILRGLALSALAWLMHQLVKGSRVRARGPVAAT